MRDYLNEGAPVHFVFPIDGDCLNERDGEVCGDVLTITAEIAAPAGCAVAVNGIAAEEQGSGRYVVRVPVAGDRAVLTAVCGADSAEVEVYRLRDVVGKYRLSVDDNILFLADITAHADEYRSIFDNPYLAVYREAHEKYGAKVHLNLFYAYTGEAKRLFSAHPDDFDLSMVTDKFRDEWAANADWLKLAFHARAEFPADPYRDSTAEEITADFLAVKREVERFAGPASFADTVTTVHYGSGSFETVCALRAQGIRALAGYFILKANGRPSVAYYAEPDLVKRVGERDFWYDRHSDMLFARIDLVLNINPNAQNLAELPKIAAHTGRGGFVSIMIHEQYFYPDYRNHRPDFADRVLDACRYLREQGYTGMHLGELFR
ncbi:MAG: hypothetical protein IJX53_06380 [Clostridia bacterium]|nr:hypothetical protein [Clostridia bacterium]